MEGYGLMSSHDEVKFREQHPDDAEEIHRLAHESTELRDALYATAGKLALCEVSLNLSRDRETAEQPGEAQLDEPELPMGMWDRLAVLENMLGIRRETELPRIDAPAQRYDTPSGDKTNSCEESRAAWRNHCFEVQIELRELYASEGSTMELPGWLANIADKLAPDAPSAPTQVVNAEVTQHPEPSETQD